LIGPPISYTGIGRYTNFHWQQREGSFINPTTFDSWCGVDCYRFKGKLLIGTLQQKRVTFYHIIHEIFIKVFILVIIEAFIVIIIVIIEAQFFCCS